MSLTKRTGEYSHPAYSLSGVAVAEAAAGAAEAAEVAALEDAEAAAAEAAEALEAAEVTEDARAMGLADAQDA
jgi:predicted nucleic acid-binding protein